MDANSIAAMMKILGQAQQQGSQTIHEMMMVTRTKRDKKRQDIQAEIAKATSALADPSMQPQEKAKVQEYIGKLQQDLADLDNEEHNEFWQLSMPNSMGVVGL